MKKILIGSFFLFLAMAVSAQHTNAYTDSERLFYEGKELHAQKKFAASTISLENYLKTADPKGNEAVQESHYYLAANAYELRKDVANHLLRKYLQDFPHTPFRNQTNFMIGTLEYERRNFKEADVWFRQVNSARLSTEDFNDYLFRYGYTLLQLKRYRESKYYFEQLLKLNTRYESAATYYYAYNEYMLKNYESALTGFKKVQDNPEYSDFVPYYIVQIYYHQKRCDELIPIAENLITKNPKNENNHEIFRILADCYYQKKDYQKTIEYLNRYIQTGKKVVRNDMYMLGVSYYNIKDYDNAVANLSKVTVEKDALSQNAYMYLGISYLALNQKQNARLAFQRAAAMDFDKDIKEEAAFNYALATYELSFSPFNESVLAFEAFLREFPNSRHTDRVHEYLVNVFLTTNNYEAAYQSMMKIKNPSPRIQEAKQRVLFNMGVDAFTAAKYDRAIELFTSSLELANFNTTTAAQARFWRGDAHYRLGNFDAARKDYNDFLLSPGARTINEFNLANYNIGYTYFNQKDYQNALTAFRKYIAASKNNKSRTHVDALNRIGDSYFALRDLNNALKFYTEAANTQAPGTDYSVFQKAFVMGLLKDYSGKITTMRQLINDFPSSEYKVDAMYEIGHAYIMLSDYEKAIAAFNELYQKFPASSLARKGLLQKGMLYYNLEQFDHAIQAYKLVIQQYPKSEEAIIALESLERIYVQTNQVDVYAAYVKTLSTGGLVITAEREDSLTFVAAERQYLLENLAEAAKHLDNYLKKFPNGKFTLKAQYYLADSYYRVNEKAKAFEVYKIIAKQNGNPYMEESVARVAEIAYDLKEYAQALEYFKLLKTISENSENIAIANLGILRSSDFLNMPQGVISIANEMLENPRIDIEQAREARFRRAKAFIALNEAEKALPDLIELSHETRHVYGAEANYLLAHHYFVTNQDELAEQTIFNFIDKHTPHQYWLARSFILLADIYIRKGDDFQAKQYLLSLQENYKQADSIQEMITERLRAIDVRERGGIITDVNSEE